MIDIKPRDRARFKQAAGRDGKSFESLPIRTRLTDEEVARFAAQRFRFPGVDIKARLFRQYPLRRARARTCIGYIGRINQATSSSIEDGRRSTANYRGTDYIGKLGVEASYETELHGTTGFEQVEIDAGGRGVRTLSRSAVAAGQQRRADARHRAAGGGRGRASATGAARWSRIDPSDRRACWRSSASRASTRTCSSTASTRRTGTRSTNRSTSRCSTARCAAPIRPGSTFKPFMALAALETGKRTPQQAIYDPGYFAFGSHTFRDDKEGGHGAVDMYKSIVQSCDTYYYMLANDLGIDAIARLHDAVRLRPAHRHRHRRASRAACCRRPSGSGSASAARAAEVVRRRDDLARHRPGLQRFTLLQLAQATGDARQRRRVYKPHLVARRRRHRAPASAPRRSPRSCARIAAASREHIDVHASARWSA